MQTDLINNAGVINFAQEMEEQMRSSTHFDIAVAFVTTEAVEMLKSFLSLNKNKQSHGRLITGLYHCFNSKEVLLELQELVLKSNGRLIVQISRNERFHWKYYKFEHKDKVIAYVGSSNFTKSGMTDAGELQMKLTLTANDKSLKKQLLDVFNKEFENSVDITKIPFAKYKQAKLTGTNSNNLDASIRNILFEKKIKKIATVKSQPLRVIFIKKTMSSATQKLISKYKSNWESNGINYFHEKFKSTFDKNLKAQTLFLITTENKKYFFSIIDIVDSCILTTPDGNYFTAHTSPKRIQETKLIRSQLEAVGLKYHVRYFEDRALVKKEREKIMQLFNK